MSDSVRHRYLVGAGAAACALCCATPIVTALGLIGVGATVAAFVFAGAVFGLVVVGAVLAVLGERRRRTRQASTDSVDVTIASRRPEHMQ